MAKLSNRDTWLVPQTGHAVPQDDEAAIFRSSLGLDRQAEIFVAHGPQGIIMSRVEVLRRRTLGKRGMPLPGLRLSQVPQAGKSKTFEQYIKQLHERCRLAGLPHNPYRVLYVGLEVSTTIKMLCKRLLKMLGDPHWEVGNKDDLRQRMHEFMLARGVELLIVDEVQHLSRESNDRIDVTDELKRLLDNGTVPLVLIGDENSLPFFQRNQALAGRLGSPLELSPLRPSESDQATLFKTFCHNLDSAMVAAEVFPEPAGLAEARAVKALFVASGGHIGRVCRIVEAAVEHAAFRDASRVEPYDLWSAVNTFAIPSKWLVINPFEARAK